MKTLQVSLGERSYPIYIGSGLISHSALFNQAITGKQVLIVSNETIAPLYLEKLQQSLRSLPLQKIDKVILADGEQHKHTGTLNQIYDVLLKERHHRTTTLIALGGGVVGDITGFAAATYQRGVNFIQVPTTLLAQVDSSVGGKTGVNHPQGKNMIGAFHQPKAVVIDTDTLHSLPAREFSAGLAEVIKYGLIQDAAFFSWLENTITLLMKRDVDSLMNAIEVSCRIKAEIVASDERESGRRALLNFGHTFGHAIEAHQGYGDWLHGEAVASGMLIASALSARKNWLVKKDVDRVRDILGLAKLPVSPPAEMTVSDFMNKMMLDKKNLTDSVRFILLKKLGSAVIAEETDASLVEGAIADCR